ncbi:MAG: hypothetical protein IPK22_03895 [Verrucomicrobiaceae bacterium]|nr:hypothetical protein [Verrucomicrobiaceae bacterium]
MKTKSTLLLILAALSVLSVAGHAQLDSETQDLGFIINAPMPPLDHPIHPGAPQPVLVPNHPSAPALPPVHRNTQAPAPSPSRALPAANVPAAAQFLAGVLANGQTVRLSDLFLNPEFFAAAHAAGPEADALRGQIDWLMLSGVILGFDGMDGSDDLRGSDDPDEIAAQTKPAENGFVFGTTAYIKEPATDGFVFGTTSYAKQPQANGFVFGTTTYLKEPAADGFVFGTTSYAKEPTTNGFIYGQTAYVKGLPAEDGFIFGTRTYLAGDSQDHNPDVAND